MIITILLTFSCRDKFHEQQLKERARLQDSIDRTAAGLTLQIEYDKFEIITFDGCEYLIHKEQPDNNKALGFMAHKGNCKNPIHCKSE